MNIIFLSNKKEISKTVRLHAGLITVVVVALFSVPVLTGLLGYKQALKVGSPAENKVTSLLKNQVQGEWQTALVSHENEINSAIENADNQFKALTVRVAELQAKLMRLDALGERIVLASNLPRDEFDFSRLPPIGGPQETSQPYAQLDFISELENLAGDIDEREKQLNVLEDLLANQKIEEEVFLAGQPIRKGWMSSRFGRRTDPFTGRLAWHKGVDFAGKEGTDIISVASGVVTWAGRRSGYGYLVEVNHGNGIVTRYGHCKKMLVKAGDVVRKGQVVALVGSSGRSTGPHVHFEVIKNGKHVDPAKYIHRASR